jgi:hypothetical protein
MKQGYSGVWYEVTSNTIQIKSRRYSHSHCALKALTHARGSRSTPKRALAWSRVRSSCVPCVSCVSCRVCRVLCLVAE